MRVNSAHRAFFNTRVAVVTIVMLAIFFVATSFTDHPDRDLRAKQVNLMIRQIGHQLLLQAGDSTSGILPVTETQEGTFQLRFENEFNFNHDSLIALSQGLLPKTLFPSGYTVTVHECLKASIVYGFLLSNTAADILACRGRSQSAGCYVIEIVFPDLYEHVARKKNVERKKADIDQLTKAPKSIKTDPQDADPKSREFKTTALKNELLVAPRPSQSYPLINLVFGGAVVLLVVSLLIGKILAPASAKNQDHSISKEPGAELATLGKFSFDVKQQCLLLESEVIALTDKEYRILELLNENFGELIRRETLMQKVWINEGVITSRSLDVFVSKLRKKLSRDPELRITNVHGKGYKLEIPGIQTS